MTHSRVYVAWCYLPGYPSLTALRVAELTSFVYSLESGLESGSRQQREE